MSAPLIAKASGGFCGGSLCPLRGFAAWLASLAAALGLVVVVGQFFGEFAALRCREHYAPRRCACSYADNRAASTLRRAAVAFGDCAARYAARRRP